MSKILEKHIHDCLSDYLNEHNLLHKPNLDSDQDIHVKLP